VGVVVWSQKKLGFLLVFRERESETFHKRESDSRILLPTGKHSGQDGRDAEDARETITSPFAEF